MKITKWMIFAAANGQLGKFFVWSKQTIVFWSKKRMIVYWRSKTDDLKRPIAYKFLSRQIGWTTDQFSKTTKSFWMVLRKEKFTFSDRLQWCWWRELVTSTSIKTSSTSFELKISEIQQNLYQELIRRFVPNKKEGKFIHRIKKIHRKINWEIERCPAAGVAVSQIIFQVTFFTGIF